MSIITMVKQGGYKTKAQLPLSYILITASAEGGILNHVYIN